MLNFTQKQFSDFIHQKLGRGRRHAALIYSNWMRTGAIRPEEWAEPQAQALVKQIVAVANWELPEVSKQLLDEPTCKFLLKLSDGLETESVAIPMESGVTLCISSQVGCRKGCAFCETGRMGLLRNLTAAEIIAQVFVARHRLGITVRNIVFMGMGEPFDNYAHVMQAIAILTDPHGLGFGPSRITISTSGDADTIRRFGRDADPALNLAVSVNAPNDMIRNRIMPVNRKWNLGELRLAMEEYLLHPRRQILAEYVLLEGINDSVECADQLADYLEGLRVKINLIPYNSQSRLVFSPPTLEKQELFKQALRARGFQTLLRHHKGRQIMAACGQLGNLQIRKQRV